MSARRSVLDRMVAALERIAPPLAPPTDWLSQPAYRWTAEGAVPVESLVAHPLATLRGIDQQKRAVVDNVTRLAKGHAAHDMLLWGARGMGKSALIASAVVDTQTDDRSNLALIEIAHGATESLPSLLAELPREGRAFLLLIDDLGFGPNGASEVLSLRSALEGGIVARPSNVRFAVTSNRRAIVNRSAEEQASALNPRDDRDDALALADRFGLSLGFHPCDRATYLEIVRAYSDPLSLEFDEEEALAWSIARGALSGRAAHQFAIELAGRAGLSLD